MSTKGVAELTRPKRWYIDARSDGRSLNADPYLRGVVDRERGWRRNPYRFGTEEHGLWQSGFDGDDSTVGGAA